MDESHFIKYLFVGDSSRYDFATEMCGRRVETGVEVELLYGKEYTQTAIGGGIRIESPSVSPGFCFTLPADFDAYADEDRIESHQEVFVFTEYPYCKEQVMELFENDAITPYNATLILYKKKRKFGYSDLDTEEDVIRRTESHCENKCKKIVIYDECAPNRRFLLTDYNFIDRISHDFARDFKRNYDNFKDTFSSYYNILICGEITEEQPRVFEYAKVRYCLGDIGVVFVNGYAKEVFTETFNEKILELCKIYLSDIFSEKHISSVAARMYIQIKNSYEKHFRKAFLSKTGMIEMPDNEIDYMKRMNDKNIVSIFVNLKNSFFAEEQKPCQKILYKAFYEIERLLKKAGRTIN